MTDNVSQHLSSGTCIFIGVMLSVTIAHELVCNLEIILPARLSINASDNSIAFFGSSDVERYGMMLDRLRLR